ncbi:glycosyltransferase [Periweissella cryptocerci]|nr:glycosyltransferase [Periweissella cryptocerci]
MGETKKVLIVSSTASMIKQFNMRNIEILQELGNEVHVAANFVEPGTITKRMAEHLQEQLQEMGVTWYQVDFGRGAGSLKSNMKAYKQIHKIIKQGYSFVHTQASLASMLTRLATHVTKTPLIYMAHGFQFYKGSSTVSWLVYYNIEKFLSRWTDLLITINHEDTKLAKKKFHAGEVIEVPGVGINYNKFATPVGEDVIIKTRSELGVPQDAKLLISVGELSARKNHRIVIEALAKLNNPNLYYVIAGIGPLKDELNELIAQNHLGDNVKLLGYRSDLPELYQASNAAIFPSKFEGLMVAGMEAMAAGVPLLYADVRGIRDYSEDGRTGFSFNYDDVGSVAKAMKQLANVENRDALGISAQQHARQFEMAEIDGQMKAIYNQI